MKLQSTATAALVLAVQPSFAQDDCRQLISANCLATLDAGASPAAIECPSQWANYRACLERLTGGRASGGSFEQRLVSRRNAEGGDERGLRECPACPEMVAIPTGAFVMGSPLHERGRNFSESPRREVVVPAFAISVSEVTNAQWRACLQDKGCGGYEPTYSGSERANYPVISVSWRDARAYAEWLSKKTGATYRLPSEAEWEYAARAGSNTPYWWGDTANRKQASYGPFGQTKPVRSYPANPFGLYDVHGNVWEWTEDCWNNSYVDAPKDGSAWSTGDCEFAPLRGGSWNSLANNLRAANRKRSRRDGRGLNAGFRVARSLER